MSKILIYGDVHWSQYSSILRKRNEHFSMRLENLINSLSWVEDLSAQLECDEIICLGDFFDKPELNSEEITALSHVQWNHHIPHTFIVGNHESNINTLQYSSTNSLGRWNFNIVSQPSVYKRGSTEIILLPYILEEDRKPLSEYTKDCETHKRVILSHNDLKGIKYGAFESVEGFSIDDIQANCKLFINGHIHNCGFINAGTECTILNLGNLTGQNFSEDAFNHGHVVCVLDTETLTTDFYENPFAFNFYKVEVNDRRDFFKLANLKDNAVVSLKCSRHLVDDLKNLVNMTSNIVEYKIILSQDKTDAQPELVNAATLNKVDHLQQFKEFILDKVGSYDTVIAELNHIVGGN